MYFAHVILGGGGGGLGGMLPWENFECRPSEITSGAFYTICEWTTLVVLIRHLGPTSLELTTKAMEWKTFH